MKPTTDSLKDFITQGMAAVETKFAEPRNGLQSVITITTPIYEGLLKKAFNHAPLFTGKTNGENRPIRYDSTTRLFFSKEDGRLVIPIKLIELQLKQNATSPMSNLGAELVRQAKAGNVEKSLLKYDKDGNYLGVEINGEIMSSEDVHKIHDSKICTVCQNPSSAKCGGCKGVSYCSAACQKVDWPIHKSLCPIFRDGAVFMK